jgi:hypothetical protein
MSVNIVTNKAPKIQTENRSNTIVNLGKGIYGLKEWVVEGGVVIDTGDSNDDSKVSACWAFFTSRFCNSAMLCAKSLL